MTRFIERRIIEKVSTYIKLGSSKSLEQSETDEARAEQLLTYQTGAKTTLEHNIQRSIRPTTLNNADTPTRNSDGRFQFTFQSGAVRNDLLKQNPNEPIG